MTDRLRSWLCRVRQFWLLMSAGGKRMQRFNEVTGYDRAEG